MKYQAGLFSIALLGSVIAAGSAFASTDVSINTAAYTYASWDAAGNPVANNIGPAGGDGVTNNDISYWTATTTFNLASASDVLNITDLASDDRVVVQLNGVDIAAAGIFGPGAGTFIYTPGGSQVPYTFLANGAQSISVSGPFNAGSNTITLIVNNTNNGIFGGFTQGPSSLFFTGVISQVGGGVPEPATWALTLTGFGLAGAALRRRRSVAAAA
jgi:hypothetical protein